jgi:hypothetical protein
MEEKEEIDNNNVNKEEEIVFDIVDMNEFEEFKLSKVLSTLMQKKKDEKDANEASKVVNDSSKSTATKIQNIEKHLNFDEDLKDFQRLRDIDAELNGEQHVSLNEKKKRSYRRNANKKAQNWVDTFVLTSNQFEKYRL